jgi:hypothetical protein
VLKIETRALLAAINAQIMRILFGFTHRLFYCVKFVLCKCQGCNLRWVIVNLKNNFSSISAKSKLDIDAGKLKIGIAIDIYL